MYTLATYVLALFTYFLPTQNDFKKCMRCSLFNISANLSYIPLIHITKLNSVPTQNDYTKTAVHRSTALAARSY